MPIYSTNYSNSTITSTNYLGNRANETYSIGSPLGLLLTLTWSQSVDTPVVNYATNWTTSTNQSTNWGNDEVFTNGLETEPGFGILLENGKGLLIP